MKNIIHFIASRLASLKRIVVASLILILLSFSVSPTAYAANLVLNPSFEVDANNNGIPDNWDVETPGAIFALDNLIAHSGQKSSRFNMTPGGTARLLQGDFPYQVQGGQQYMASYWVNVQGSGSSFVRTTLEIIFFDSNNDALESMIVTADNQDGDWREISGVTTIPATAVIGRLQIRVFSPSGSPPATIWIDDVSFDLFAPNQPPSINPLTGSSIGVGDTYTENGSFNDPDSTSWTATVDYGNGSGTQPLALSGTNFTLSHVYTAAGIYTVTVIVTDNQGASGQASTNVNVVRRLTALSPAKIWIGLKNSDDVGTRFDLKTEVYKNGTELVSSGQLDNVWGGSSGFNNANLQTIPFGTFAPVDFPQGSTLSIKLYVRNACQGPTHNSGIARLWYDDAAANSRFDATIEGSSSDYYLRDNFVLSTTVGSGPKKKIDVQAGAKCSPFKTFGTWTITP